LPRTASAQYRFVSPFRRRLDLDSGIADITERNRAFTASDDLNTAAMSGSKTTATVPGDIFAANRFGFDLP